MARLREILTEPLVLFLAIGLALFQLDAWTTGPDVGDRRIVLSSGDIRSLGDQWVLQMGRPPTEQELDALIEDRIREEVLYREALRLGLDRDDTIIRRRLAQKMTFVIEDLSADDAPDEEDLVRFFDENRERYRIPERWSFSHVYFSANSDDARDRAVQALDRLAEGEDPNQMGDPFMLRKAYVERSSEEIARLFGTEFANSIRGLDAAPGWQGPVRSAYGYHLVRVDDRLAARSPSIDELGERLQADYRDFETRQRNRERLEEMRSAYTVEVQSP